MSKSRLGKILGNPIVRSTLCAVFLAAVGFIPLLGIPGALIYEGVAYLLNDICGLDIVAEVTGDSAWPFALIITLLWPWSLVLGTLLGWKALPDGVSVKLRWLTLLATVFITCVLLIVIGSNQI